GCLPGSLPRRTLPSFDTALHLLDPLLGRRGVVFVVPVPPLIRLGLRVALGRVFPHLLPSERRDVEVAPGAAHRLVAATIDEISAKYLSVVILDECVCAVPFIDAEVGVKAVRDGVPRHLPTHPRL